jgi:D-alanine-D-alanine ligase-like ATP-grasp enzyme
VARIDFKEDGLENPVFLEANTLPGMTKTSLLPLAAEVAGIPFGDLCLRLCVLAQERKKKRGCR